MLSRSRRSTVHFSAAFSLRGVSELMPPGDYTIVEDEELIEGASFLAYRRTGTFLVASSNLSGAHVTQMFPIDPDDLAATLRNDERIAEGTE